MGLFYTVKMVAKRIISKYDDKGVKISEREELIPQTYHDLPWPTANAYKTKFPDAQVEIIAQSAEFGTRRDGVSRPSARHTARPAQQTHSRAPTPAKSSSARAAETGDLSAALNGEVDR